MSPTPEEKQSIREGEKKGIEPTDAVAEVIFSSKGLQSTQDLHRYAMEAMLTLKQPPAQQFRLQLLWPTTVRVTQLKGLIEGEEFTTDVKNARFTFKELWLLGRESVFPGQTLKIIGPGTATELNYEIDHQTHAVLSRFNMLLRYTLYLESHMPIKGDVPFSELQQF
jgi:hypothetical protein